MYLEDLDDFYTQAEALFISDPLRTRFCLKYNNAAGKLVLKVTNDRKVQSSSLPCWMRVLSADHRLLRRHCSSRQTSSPTCAR